MTTTTALLEFTSSVTFPVGQYGALNGVQLPLEKLGHNRAEKRGFHPYVVAVPLTDTYTLNLKGKTTLIGCRAQVSVTRGTVDG